MTDATKFYIKDIINAVKKICAKMDTEKLNGKEYKKCIQVIVASMEIIEEKMESEG